MDKMNENPAAQSSSVSPLLYPLDDFYTRMGRELPAIQPIDGDIMPEPYKSLLVHQDDMTPTLQNFHRDSIHVHALHTEERDNYYFREVLLELDETERPVEYGVIKINLSLVPDDTRHEIIEAHLPLGQILFAHDVLHESRPKAYLQMDADEHISGVLRLDNTHKLYGRRNTLTDTNGRPLAEIVEILPPESD